MKDKKLGLALGGFSLTSCFRFLISVFCPPYDSRFRISCEVMVMAMMGLLTAPMATDHDSAILPALGELAGLCRRFADSDCCDTEAFREIVRDAERLSREIPPVCGPLGELVYLALVVFKARPADLDCNGARAVANALASVESIYLEPEALGEIRRQLAGAGINLRPF